MGAGPTGLSRGRTWQTAAHIHVSFASCSEERRGATIKRARSRCQWPRDETECEDTMHDLRSTVSVRRARCVLAAELLTVLAVSPLLAAGHPSTAHTAIAHGAGALMLTPTIHRTNGYQIGTYYFSGWS